MRIKMPEYTKEEIRNMQKAYEEKESTKEKVREQIEGMLTEHHLSIRDAEDIFSSIMQSAVSITQSLGFDTIQTIRDK